jgi:hypothetical protein
MKWKELRIIPIVSALKQKSTEVAEIAIGDRLFRERRDAVNAVHAYMKEHKFGIPDTASQEDGNIKSWSFKNFNRKITLHTIEVTCSIDPCLDTLFSDMLKERNTAKGK